MESRNRLDEANENRLNASATNNPATRGVALVRGEHFARPRTTETTMTKSKKSKAAVAVREGGEFEAMAAAPALVTEKKAKKRKAAPTVEQDAPTAAPAEKAPELAEVAPAATETPAAEDDGLGWIDAPPTGETIADLKAAFLAHLEAEGHTPLTRSSYARDLDIAVAYFGPTRKVATITAEEIEAFNRCDLVLNKPKGSAKAMPTILKTRRVLRLALAWSRGERKLAEHVA